MGSVRISPALEEKIGQVAIRNGISRSDLFREALEIYCSHELTEPSASRFDDIIGIVDVPGEFSTNIRQEVGEMIEQTAGRRGRTCSPEVNAATYRW